MDGGGGSGHREIQGDAVMATLRAATRPLQVAKMFEPVEQEPFRAPAQMAPATPVGPGMFTICPLPKIVAYPDGLRQYYRDGIPQQRVIPPG